MASRNLASIAAALPRAGTYPSAPLGYVLTYEAKNWSHEIILLDGDSGALSLSYPTMNEAQDAGTKWAHNQLKDHLRTYDPRLNTEEEVDAEFDAWQKSSSEQGDEWSYTVSKGDESLVVTAAKWVEGASYSVTYGIRV